MTRVRLSPATRLVLVAIAGLFVASAAVWAATAPPWLGVGLRADTDTGAVHVQSPALGEGRLVRLGGLDVEAQDLVEEVDYLPDYTAVDRFFQRQSAFLRALQAPTVALEVARAEGVVETVEVTPGERPLSALPSTFWLQLVFGLSGLFIGGWVWALRSKDLPALMFALTGLGMLAFSTSAGIYSTRELTLGGPMFRALSAVNHAGAMTFGAAMIALFLVYPRRVARPWMLAAIGLLFAVWLAVDLAHLVPSVSLGASGAVTIQMLLIVAAIGVQWFANRGDPVGRAALRWLGLSVIVGAGSFIALSVVPPLLGAQPLISQGYAFGFFVLIYAGLAIGLRRHRRSPWTNGPSSSCSTPWVWSACWRWTQPWCSPCNSAPPPRSLWRWRSWPCSTFHCATACGDGSWPVARCRTRTCSASWWKPHWPPSFRNAPSAGACCSNACSTRRKSASPMAT